jgi:predicted esterase
VLDAQDPAVRTRVPMRIFQGTADTAVPKALTDQLAAELRARHDRLEYSTYPATNHVQIVAAAQAQVLTWLRRRL